MVPFAGWEMPVMYSSIIAEHKAVREHCGVFDISHMGQIFVNGTEAEGWLNSLLTNDVSDLEDSMAQYTFLLNEDGGVIDDLILYRMAPGRYFLVVNASCIERDVAWLRENPGEGIEVVNESPEWAGLAVQGPKAPEVYTAITGGRTLPTRNHVDDLQVESYRLIICRTGYTGEDGFELFCPVSQAAKWWNLLLEEGVTPCGLGARDSLRLEMCYPLNGSDLTTAHSPVEAGLGFFVKPDKGEFPGRDTVAKQKEDGCRERLVAIKVTGPGAPPRPGYPVVGESGDRLGELTSGALSPSLGHGIALAYLPKDRAKVGTAVAIVVRGKKIPAQVVKKPFYRK